MDKENHLIQEQQFAEVVNIIVQHQGRASRAVNEEVLLTAWNVGNYVSTKLKSEEWGSKVVSQLSEFIRSHHPEMKGYSRSSLYNMVMFYDEYSSTAFLSTVEKFMTSESVQSTTARLGLTVDGTATLTADSPLEIVQPKTGQMPSILNMTTLSNHIEILCNCKSHEQRLFYILYAYKERLKKRELQRCLSNQTYETLLSKKPVKRTIGKIP